MATCNRFEIELPNWHQICILGLVLKLGVIDHGLQGYLGHFVSEFQEMAFNNTLVYWSRLAKGVTPFEVIPLLLVKLTMPHLMPHPCYTSPHLTCHRALTLQLTSHQPLSTPLTILHLMPHLTPHHTLPCTTPHFSPTPPRSSHTTPNITYHIPPHPT